jgi:hypothetical protein
MKKIYYKLFPNLVHCRSLTHIKMRFIGNYGGGLFL